jgi:diguanylate cyclase (GGDEF)-like protein/PAS domain S-box-containing protein
VLRIIACIHEDHDIRLVLLAAVVCAFGCYTAVSLTARSRAATSHGWMAWGCGAALAFGSCVWSTHFIAMLAFAPELHAGFEIARTVLSLAVAVVGSLAAFGLFLAFPPSKPVAVVSGVLLGVTIAGMHFLGMAAFTVPALLTYDPVMAAWSIIAGVGFATAALLLTGPRRARAISAGLLTLAICGLHFTAMAAVSVLPLAGFERSGSSIQPELLAIAVAAVSMMILLPSLGGAIFDQYLARRGEREAARLRKFAVSTFEGILFHRDGIVIDANAAFCRMRGCAPDHVIGQPLRTLFTNDSYQLLAGIDPNEAGAAIEAQLLDDDGGERVVELFDRAVEMDGHRTQVLIIRDLSDRRAAERQIAHLVHYDILTGLANRLLFRDRLGLAVANAERAAESVALLYVDLDRFKAVNDQMGHPVGDQLLIQVAGRLSASSRPTDTIARLGGDEFAIVVPHASPAVAAQIAGRLVAELSEPFDIDGRQIHIGASVGIGMYPDDGLAPETLLKNADLALYRAKQEGRGTWRFFEAEMDLKQQERRMAEQDLRGALANGELLLHYQPQFDSTTLDVLGYEALVRWDHPSRGRIAPGDFIPVAEECGLIIPLGYWVLETACVEAATWSEPYRIAVNLSPVQFRQVDLPQRIAEILARTGLDPRRLELEVTEGVLIDEDRSLAVLTAIREQGIRIALDDFGTGYSSLSYLRRFAFDKIKIDRAFVQALGRDESADAIVGTILALARGLRITVTAEGVETAGQLAELRQRHCEQVQGFLLGRPVSNSELFHRTAVVDAAA